MSESILDIPVNQDIYEIYERNDNISINIYNNKFTLEVGGYVRSIQPYEILKFVGDIKTVELDSIQPIPNNPIQFGNIIGIILNAQIRPYSFRWPHDKLEVAFGEARFILKELNIHNMSGAELKANSYLRNDPEMNDKDYTLYYKIYGDLDLNPVLPIDNSKNIYSCKLFQPEFLIINNGDISAGGFINDTTNYDYKLHMFKDKLQFDDIFLVPEATNTYNSGKLCVQSANSIAAAIDHYYNDIYNNDLTQNFFKYMVTLQYKFANEHNINTSQFFDILSDSVRDYGSNNVKSMISSILM